MTKNVLGRGLSALIGEESVEYADKANNKSRSEWTFLPIALLHAGTMQPRSSFDPEALEELSKSIERNGLIQPLVVRRSSDDSYEIIAGERRWRAAMMANLEKVPVIIRDIDDKTALEIAVIENIQRQDLNPVEEARGYKKLVDEFSYTQEELSRAVGKSRSHVANMLRILTLPDDIIAMVESKKITFGHAKVLLGLSNPSMAAKNILDNSMSVRQAEILVKKLIKGDKIAVSDSDDIKQSLPCKVSGAVSRSMGDEDDADINLRELSSSLSASSGLRVKVKINYVTVEYSDQKELERIIELIGNMKVCV